MYPTKIAHFKIRKRNENNPAQIVDRLQDVSRETTVEYQQAKESSDQKYTSVSSWSFMIVDKLVIALVVALAAGFSNYYGQRKNAEYVSVSTLRQADLGEIKKAFNDVWPKLYAYETEVNELAGAARALILHKDIFPKSLPTYQADFEKRKAEESKGFQTAYDAIKAQQHVLGVEMTSRAELYLRYTRYIATIHEDAPRRTANSLTREIDEKAIAAVEKTREKMRLSLTDLNNLY